MAYTITKEYFNDQSNHFYSDVSELTGLINQLTTSKFQIFEKILSHNRLFLDIEKIEYIGGNITTGTDLVHFIANEFNKFFEQFLKVELTEEDKKYIITKNASSESYHVIFNYATDITTAEYLVTLFKNRYRWGQIIDNLIYNQGGLFKCIGSVKPLKKGDVGKTPASNTYHYILYSDFIKKGELTRHGGAYHKLTLEKSLIGNLKDCKIFTNIKSFEEVGRTFTKSMLNNFENIYPTATQEQELFELEGSYTPKSLKDTNINNSINDSIAVIMYSGYVNNRIDNKKSFVTLKDFFENFKNRNLNITFTHLINDKKITLYNNKYEKIDFDSSYRMSIISDLLFTNNKYFVNYNEMVDNLKLSAVSMKDAEKLEIVVNSLYQTLGEHNQIVKGSLNRYTKKIFIEDYKVPAHVFDEKTVYVLQPGNYFKNRPLLEPTDTIKVNVINSGNNILYFDKTLLEKKCTIANYKTQKELIVAETYRLPYDKFPHLFTACDKLTRTCLKIFSDILYNEVNVTLKGLLGDHVNNY